MALDQEITFTVHDGALQPDQALGLPEGARGVATIRGWTPPQATSKPAAIAAIRKIAESGVFNSAGIKIARDEMHERD